VTSLIEGASIPFETRSWKLPNGRYTRLARKPRCEICMINDLCRWPEKMV
jgi:endonuclease-3